MKMKYTITDARPGDSEQMIAAEGPTHFTADVAKAVVFDSREAAELALCEFAERFEGHRLKVEAVKITHFTTRADIDAAHAARQATALRCAK